MSELTHSKTKIHRHFVPEFVGSLPNISIVKRFSAAAKMQDWNRNKPIHDLRAKRNQRISIRSERRETFAALAIALIAYADYNPESEYCFEIMTSTENLAKLCNQLYQYESGRKTYDPIRLAIKDLRAAGLLIVKKGKDPDTKQEKAQRMWLHPDFFKCLGFPLQELRKIIAKFKKWMINKGLRESYQQRYSDHLKRIARSNVASLDGDYKLKGLLKKLKRMVTGQDDDLIKEVEHSVKAAKHRKELEKATRTKTDNQAWREYQKWKQSQPAATCFVFEAKIKEQYPNVFGDELYQIYLNNLPDK